MIRKIKTLILTLAIALGAGAPTVLPAVASAAVNTNTTINNGLCTGVNDAAGAGSQQDCFGTGANENGTLKSLATKIINIFSIIVGVVAVIMIIYGGFRYITSGGDSSRVGNAKNTLIYAIIGLIIVALAQFLVHFVLTTATNSINPSA